MLSEFSSVIRKVSCGRGTMGLGVAGTLAYRVRNHRYSGQPIRTRWGGALLFVLFLRREQVPVLPVNWHLLDGGVRRVGLKSKTTIPKLHIQ